MDHLKKNNLKNIFLILLLWIVAFRIFIIIRFWGYSSDTIQDVMPGVLVLFNHNLFLSTLVGLFMGLVHGLLQVYVFGIKWKHLRFQKIFIIRIFIYLISLIVTTSIVFIAYSLISKQQSLYAALFAIPNLMKDKNYLAVVVYGLIISVVLFYFDQINRKLGSGEIWNILTGKYYLPKEEERIFMFLDLEDSTPIAERLGHVKFSHLIQDCFAEIAQFVVKHKATVYQHVGDEVVLTWRYPKSSYKHVFDLFFEFSDYLKENENRYMQKYGVLPHFRASVNGGIVTVAQVGYTKKETAFYGQVLIIAARMQKLCKKYNADLLASHSCIKDLNETSSYQFEALDKIVLKGKSASTLIYRIQRDKKNSRTKKTL